MVSFFNQFKDKFGLILTAAKDGGDAAARTGFWGLTSFVLFKIGAIGLDDWLQIRADFNKASAHLEPYPGIFIRHPERSKNWEKEGARDFARWNDWLVFSRDNFMQYMGGLLVADDGHRKGRAIEATERHHGLLQNGDIMGPSHWGVFLRARNYGPSLKWLYLCDLFLLGGVIIQSIKKDASDSVNGLSMLMIAKHFNPTFLSNAALWWAKHLDNYEKYFIEYFGNPKDPGAPFHEYCKPIFKEYF